LARASIVDSKTATPTIAKVTHVCANHTKASLDVADEGRILSEVLLPKVQLKPCKHLQAGCEIHLFRPPILVPVEFKQESSTA
jgi:hypothetical protein